MWVGYINCYSFLENIDHPTKVEHLPPLSPLRLHCLIKQQMLLTFYYIHLQCFTECLMKRSGFMFDDFSYNKTLIIGFAGRYLEPEGVSILW